MIFFLKYWLTLCLGAFWVKGTHPAPFCTDWSLLGVSIQAPV